MEGWEEDKFSNNMYMMCLKFDIVGFILSRYKFPSFFFKHFNIEL